MTSLPLATARLVVDTDVASYILEAYLGDFSVLHSDSLLCSAWAEVRNESGRKGRQMSSADAWIAAPALVLSAPLMTNNPKDYRHLDKLQLVSAAAG